MYGKTESSSSTINSEHQVNRISKSEIKVNLICD